MLVAIGRLKVPIPRAFSLLIEFRVSYNFM